MIEQMIKEGDIITHIITPTPEIALKMATLAQRVFALFDESGLDPIVLNTIVNTLKAEMVRTIWNTAEGQEIYNGKRRKK